MMTYERFVARRQTRAIRRRRRVSITSRIASGGVGVGVAAAIIVLSVMNGFSGLLWERLLSLHPHVVIRTPDRSAFTDPGSVAERLEDVRGVTGVARFRSSQGFVMRRGVAGAYQAATRVLSMDEEGLASTSDLSRFLWAGTLDVGLQPEEEDVYGVVVGSYLADRLGASVGSEVRLAFPPQQIGTGRTPPVRRYIVTGIFSTGYAEFDGGLSLISLDAADRDLRMGGAIDGYRIRLRDPLLAGQVASKIADDLAGELVASPWMAEHGNLYASIQLEKWSFYLGLSLIVVIAGFNIISIVSLNVAEQRKEIGILKAMGAQGYSITRIFALTGLRMGVVGVVGGVVAGLGICGIQILFEPLQLPGDLFIVNALPVDVRIFDLAVVTGVALTLCLLFAFLPARSAAALDPVETLRS